MNDDDYPGVVRTRRDGDHSRVALRGQRTLPTVPCSVVWSGGRAFVLESVSGSARWVGFDAFGRPQSLSNDALERRGWSLNRGART